MKAWTLPGILRVIEQWLGELETGNFQVNPLTSGRVPQLKLGWQGFTGQGELLSGVGNQT